MEWTLVARVVAATLLPGVPFIMMRWALHLRSGLVNLDYLLLTLLACAGWRRVSAVLFVLVYAMESIRILDGVYFFSQQDVGFVAQFVTDVPRWLVAAWLLAFVALCVVSLKLWLAVVPDVHGVRLWGVAVPLLLLSVILAGVDVVQGFNPMLKLPHAKPREHMVGELLVRMPLELMRGEPHGDVIRRTEQSATEPLWTDGAIRQERENVVVVVVESMGLLQDEAARKKEFAAFEDPLLRQRYAVEEGVVDFHGATVSGEMRELCHLRTGTHISQETFAGQPACLPQQFRASGYETAAYHGYRGMMFLRERWYPSTGFSSMNFLPSLQHERMCNGAFYGACDSSVGRLLEERLVQKMAAGAPPQFLYWMTLNGHLPVDAERAPQRPCPVADADHEVCAQLAYTGEVLDAVRQMALNSHIGRTAIVVVGDHAPPYISAERRHLFADGSVPFVRLMPRG